MSALKDLCVILDDVKLDTKGKNYLKHNIRYRQYASEKDLYDIITLISKDLSEPYSIYTYRYFLYNWPELCIVAVDENDLCVGTIVCRTENHSENIYRGYIAMLAVQSDYRRKGIVQLALELVQKESCDEIVLETETSNKAALALYEQFGFIRDKRLTRYYLNGADAFRLKLWISDSHILRLRY